jgi:hypothetical protein
MRDTILPGPHESIFDYTAIEQFRLRVLREFDALCRAQGIPIEAPEPAAYASEPKSLIPSQLGKEAVVVVGRMR